MAKHKVTFLPAGVTVEVDEAMYPYGDHGLPGSILDVALTHGVSIEHACGGAGACGTCHVHIEKGMESLSPITDEELDLIETRPQNTRDSRIACLAVIKGDVTVRVLD